MGLGTGTANALVNEGERIRANAADQVARATKSVSVSTENHDRLTKEADRRDVSVAFLVNRLVARSLPALEAADLDAIFPATDARG